MTLIAFASPKGGVGKTTIAAHTAALLAQRGHRVVALDLDPQNSLRLHFGMPLKDEEGLLSSLLGSKAPDWRSLARETTAGVQLVPHGALDPSAVLELGQLLAERPGLLATPVRDMLAEPGLVLVVDTAPGPSAALNALLPQVSLLATILLADAASASLLPQVASGRFLGRGVLAARAAERTALVMNQVALDQALSTEVLAAAEQAMGDRLLGAIRHDPALAEALADKRLLLSGDQAAEDLCVLTDSIVRRAGLPRPGTSTRSTVRGARFSALADWHLR